MLGKYITYNMFSTIYYIQQTKIVLHVYANYWKLSLHLYILYYMQITLMCMKIWFK